MDQSAERAGIRKMSGPVLSVGVGLERLADRRMTGCFGIGKAVLLQAQH